MEFKKPTLKYALLVFDWICPLIDLEKLFVPLAAYSFFVVGSALKYVLRGAVFVRSQPWQRFF